MNGEKNCNNLQNFTPFMLFVEAEPLSLTGKDVLH